MFTHPLAWGISEQHKALIFHYLENDDPVRQVIDKHELLSDAHAMKQAIVEGKPEHSVFFAENRFDVLLYGYYTAEIFSLDEFILIQDYLHILADAAIEGHRDHDEVLVKLPVRSITMRPDLPKEVFVQRGLKVSDEEYNKSLKPFMFLRWKFEIERSERSNEFWVTIVDFDPEFLIYRDSLKLGKYCTGQSIVSLDRCLQKNYYKPEYQYPIWINILKYSTPDLLFFSDGHHSLYLNSPVLFLNKSRKEGSPEFLPLYGALSFDDMVELRKKNINPGSIYHPDCLTNEFYPHGFYSGAAMMFRHDMAHQALLDRIPPNHRQFFLWLHEQEQTILAKMDRNFLAYTSNDKDVVYRGTPSLASDAFSYAIHSLLEDESELDLLPYLSLQDKKLTYFWEQPKQHASLFPGDYADMNFIYPYGVVKDEELIGSQLLDIFMNRFAEASFRFPSTFELYLSELVKVIAVNKIHIDQSFQLDASKILQSLIIEIDIAASGVEAGRLLKPRIRDYGIDL
ncbi:hypothetical protein [Endozoicomonas sp. OPT23]|uniref:hypothetical protein n=1 Tax=Endozoicomonas sp. OPT23 TaxID=2072845 RepID=UPI00129AD4DE|nr:hypothetical protein [Endozoicomonas sp. OPT23]